jgi:hypothetical protein
MKRVSPRGWLTRRAAIFFGRERNETERGQAALPGCIWRKWTESRAAQR